MGRADTRPDGARLLRAGLAEFWGPETIPFEDTDLPERQRRMGALVAAGRRDELDELLTGIDPLSLRTTARQPA